MTNLKAVNIGFNKFCGPAVLSILTGKSTDECASVISSVNGSYNVKGVFITDLLKAANKMGFDTIRLEPQGSLFATLSRLAVSNEGMFIVMVPNHFVCIEVKDKKVYFCDNHTKEPIPAASSARLMQTVMGCHKVIEREKPPPEVIEPVEPLYLTVIMIRCGHCDAEASAAEYVRHYAGCKYDKYRRSLKS